MTITPSTAAQAADSAVYLVYLRLGLPDGVLVAPQLRARIQSRIGGTAGDGQRRQYETADKQMS